MNFAPRVPHFLSDVADIRYKRCARDAVERVCYVRALAVKDGRSWGELQFTLKGPAVMLQTCSVQCRYVFLFAVAVVELRSLRNCADWSWSLLLSFLTLYSSDQATCELSFLTLYNSDQATC